MNSLNLRELLLQEEGMLHGVLHELLHEGGLHEVCSNHHDDEVGMEDLRLHESDSEGTATPTYMEGNEVMFNSFQL